MDMQTVQLLLVEDEKAHAELVRRAFEPLSDRFHLKVASSLKEAREYLSGFTPNLVIADLFLPDGKGVELLIPGQEKRSFPLVMITGHGNEKVAVEAMKAGAFDYVVKSDVTFAHMPHIAERTLSQWNHIKERERTEEALQKRERDLGERVKELNCLYGLSRLDERQDILLEEFFQKAVVLIPPSWQYPEITCARITSEGREYRTENFKQTPWRQDCEISTFGERTGRLEVFYLEEKPECDEGPFLKEERRLLNAIAQHLGRIAERKWAEKALKTSHVFLETANMHTEMRPLLKEFVAQVKKLTDCEAVGIRLSDDEGNIPYEAYDGFTQRFYESESPLSIKSDKCMCTNVIKGATDSNLPFFTKGGSFYINSTTLFLAMVTEKDKVPGCQVCNAYGYESVALVPILLRDHTLGLIHVADQKEDMVPLEIVELLEGVAMQLVAAIHRVQAEESLRESEDRYRDLYEKAPNAYFSINAVDGSILRCNNAAMRLLGYDRETIMGMKVIDLYADTPYGISMAQKTFTRFMAGESIRDVELQMKHKDGNPLWISLSVEPVRDRKGNIIESRSMVIDISERKGGGGSAEGKL